MSVEQYPQRVFLYVPLLVGMLANGLLMLYWFLSPPNPDRVGAWFWSFLIVLPFLGFVGIFILAFTRSLRVSGPLLLYVAFAWGSGVILPNVFNAVFLVIDAEWLQALLYLGALVWFIIIGFRSSGIAAS